MKMMSAGKPVLVTGGEEYSRFPELAVIRVDSGEAEAEMLAHFLHALAADAEMRCVVGRTAADYVREHHGLERVAGEYFKAIRRFAAG
jgi:hypothetical protein